MPGTLMFNASPAADGTFRLVGVHGQRRLQVVRAPGRWTLKAIMADGRDITDEVLQFGAPNQPVQSIEAIFTDSPIPFQGMSMIATSIASRSRNGR